MKLLLRILYNNKMAWIVFAVTLIISCVFFYLLPDQIPIHFDNGIVDSYAPKIWLFLFPFMQLIFLLFFSLKGVRQSFTVIPKYGNSIITYYIVVLAFVILFLLSEITIIRASWLMHQIFLLPYQEENGRSVIYEYLMYCITRLLLN